MGSDKDYSVPIGTTYKQLTVCACLVGLIIEIFANTLFSWPIDHSCARSKTNLTNHSSWYVDSHQEPIDLDAFQRNLIDATPEDSFTLARAKSMGIDYDDIARCFEYPVITSHDQDSINYESLEPCRYGLNFEGASEPHVSIVDRFELACSRQWLKVLMPQATVLGILAGLILLYSFWLRPHRHRNLLMWLGINLALWLVIELIMSMVNSGSSEDFKLRHIQYKWFLISLFLRSLVISSILWRTLIIWQSKQPHHDDSIEEDHIYLVLFALIMIASKILYMPMMLRLYSDWWQLNEFLNWNLLLLIGLTCLVEFVHERKRFHLLYLLAARGNHTRDGTVAGHLMTIATQDNVEISDDIVDQYRAHDAGQDKYTRPYRGQPFGNASADKFKVCEFCSAQNEMMFGSATDGLDMVLSEMPPQGHPMRRKQGIKEGASSNYRLFLDDDLDAPEEDPYRPTTIPIEYAPDPHIKQPSTSDIGTKESAATLSGFNHEDDSSRVATKRVTMTRSMTAASQVVNYNKHPAHAHNTSLLEMNLLRWPLISKLHLLIYCLAFNYFLMQTIPNHKLMHGETISSLMARKTSHRHDTAVKKAPMGMNSSALLSAHNDSRVLAKASPLLISLVPGSTTEIFQIGEPLVATHKVGASDKSQIKDVTKEPVNAVHTGNTTLSPHTSNSNASVKPVATSPAPTVAPLVLHNATNSAVTPLVVVHNETKSTVTPLLAVHNETKLAATPKQAPDTAKQVNLTSSTKPPLVAQNRSKSLDDTLRYHIDGTTRPPFAWTKGMARHGSLFNYKSVDYATETISSLAHSWNPFEIGWTTMNLNGWPIECLVMLLFYSHWTNFAATYFKLHRLFSLVKYGSRLLIGEWLLVTVVPKQNHLLDLDWLLALALIVARLTTTLMLYSHLHMLFKLSAKMSSHRLVEAKRVIPIVLLALLTALMAPLFERLSLIFIPMVMVLSNVIIHYLAGAANEKFRALLCPMMFD